jgi:DUF177 domain-containing protein
VTRRGVRDPNAEAAAALTFNVAGLLAEPAGVSRSYDIDPVTLDPGEGLRLSTPVSGRVRVARTNRGVLVDGELTTSLATECSRCLRPIEVPLALRIESEEVVPSIDLQSGVPLERDDEPELARLTDHHELALLPFVREAILLAEPIAPVCRPDCPGLCSTCGLPLDEGVHDHPDELDPRLAALAEFRPAVDGSDRSD